MKRLLPRTIRSIFYLAVAVFSFSAQTQAQPVLPPAGIDHQPWDELLQRYVNKDGMVAYAAWKSSGEDLAKLQNYLAQFASETAESARGDDRIASLINAYNAFTIGFILKNYPVESIRLLKDEFDGKRYKIAGTRWSAEDIELETLRPLIGWKMHSPLVCAARSCPPLLNRAYFPDDWEAKMEERYRLWLASPDLNSYHPDRGWGSRGEVEVSKIFSWHSVDFKDEVSVQDVLRRFGSKKHSGFLEKATYRIKYKDYHWGLNDQDGVGADYSHSIFDSIF
jgi:hypothetical protein